jgi:hypothetical protein
MEAYTKQTREELIAICKDNKIKGYSSMKKCEIIQLLLTSAPNISIPAPNISISIPAPNISIPAPNISISITENNTSQLKMIDLFAGTGAFTNAFEKTGKVQCVFSNDMVEWSKKFMMKILIISLHLEI